MEKELTPSVINRYSTDKGIKEVEDVLITESCFTVYVNKNYYKTVLCTPSHLDELLIGQLGLNGVISAYKDIKDLEIKNENIYISVEPSPYSHEARVQLETCPRPICFAEDIVELMKQHLESSRLHRLTGGVHIMSLATGRQLLLTREDVGRHNAVDKICGYCLKNSWDCSDKIFLSSGRITHEIVQKARYLGVRVVVSRAAVTSLAQETAEKAGLTVIGFTRGERFNIYSHPQRILVKDSR